MSHSAIRRARVVVVDDEPASAKLIRAVLATAGFDHVTTYNDPRVGLDEVLTHEPDLVLLDLHMPHIGGIEFLRRMHAQQRGRAFVPVLVLTADNSPDAAKGALQAGANDFLAKPIDTGELLLRVQNLLSIRVCYQEILQHNATLARELRDRMRYEQDRAADRAQVLLAIEKVIERGGPDMVFQPFVALHSRRTVGVEALARFGTEPWRGPDEWFADAAAIGLGAALELSAIRAALRCREQLHPSWTLAVNVSPPTLFTAEFAELAACTDVHGLAFEITEHEPIDDYGALREVTDALQARGALISVDDAGAGYASLRHILKLNPDVIKLDISLTRDIDRDPVKQALAGSLVRFAEQVGAELTAEGIENARELVTMRDLGVHDGQGYYLGRPAHPAGLLGHWPTDVLAAHPRVKV
jgi:EAL domain-containing protein (putative c-di-GMP-specific phosphodiesterase class I)/CheY-like chemotaxis protein